MLEHKTSSTTTSIEKSGSGGELLQLVTSRINLVDLAGSERINNAFGGSTTTTTTASFGQPQPNNANRFKESTCINKSLLTLGKIICLLSERQTPLASIGNQNNQVKKKRLYSRNNHIFKLYIV